MRITDAANDRVTLYVDEAPNWDSAHTNETVAILILERGRWQLDDGRLLEVERSSASTQVGPGVVQHLGHRGSPIPLLIAGNGTLTAAPQ